MNLDPLSEILAMHSHAVPGKVETVVQAAIGYLSAKAFAVKAGLAVASEGAPIVAVQAASQMGGWDVAYGLLSLVVAAALNWGGRIVYATYCSKQAARRHAEQSSTVVRVVRAERQHEEDAKAVAAKDARIRALEAELATARKAATEP